jgi:phage-related tail fiber protein
MMAALVGTVIAHGAAVSASAPPPGGWLLCDGRAISRQVYRDLFQVIGTLHGSGDGVETFNLPDYRGRFHRGVDDGQGTDPDANSREEAANGGASGDNVGSVQRDATAVPTGKGRGFMLGHAGQHHHAVQHVPVWRSMWGIAGAHYAEWTDDSTDSSRSGVHTHKVTGGGDWETAPRNAYVNYLIACGKTEDP